MNDSVRNINSIMMANLFDFIELERLHDEIHAYGVPYFTAHAYYPIAILEFDMDEMVFEDFRPIEEALLKCFKVGLSSSEDISKFLGLPIRYIDAHIKNLIAKGQILDGSLTKTGQESIKSNKIIQKLNNSKQRFQTDAVFGILLPGEFQQGDSRLLEASDTIGKTFLYLKYKNEIDGDEFIEKLKGIDLINKYRRNILNTNVTNINDIKFIKMFYVPVFLVWFSKKNNPIIFFKTYIDGEIDYKPLFITLHDYDYKSKNYLCEIVSDEDMDDITQPLLSYICGIDGVNGNKIVPSIIPTKYEVTKYFENRPFEVSDFNYNKAYNDHFDVCEIYLKEGVDEITMKDIEILASCGNDVEVPITTILKTYKDGDKINNKLITFIPKIEGESLKQICKSVNKLWKEDFAKLRKIVSNYQGQKISILEIMNLIKSEQED